VGQLWVGLLFLVWEITALLRPFDSIKDQEKEVLSEAVECTNKS